jgi:hypothetical protein
MYISYKISFDIQKQQLPTSILPFSVLKDMFSYKIPANEFVFLWIIGQPLAPE